MTDGIMNVFTLEEGILSGIRIPEAGMTVRETCLYRSVREEEGMRYLVIGRSGEIKK